MIEVIFILICALGLLVLLETAFCNDVPEDVVRRKK